MTELQIHVRLMRLLLDVQRCTAQSLKEVCVVGHQVGLRQWQPGHMADGSGGGVWAGGAFTGRFVRRGQDLL